MKSCEVCRVNGIPVHITPDPVPDPVFIKPVLHWHVRVPLNDCQIQSAFGSQPPLLLRQTSKGKFVVE